MASTGCERFAAVAVAALLTLGGCVTGGTENQPTESRTTGSPTSEASAAPTSTTPASTKISASTPTGGDYDAGFGITLALAPGWELGNQTDEDDGLLHSFSHTRSGGQLLLATTDATDGDPQKMCAEAQEDLADDFDDNSTVTKVAGAAHSAGAHVCGLTGKRPDGTPVEITIFAAVGTTASFSAITIFPTQPPVGTTQEELGQALREASGMTSEMLNDID